MRAPLPRAMFFMPAIVWHTEKRALPQLLKNQRQASQRKAVPTGVGIHEKKAIHSSSRAWVILCMIPGICGSATFD